MGDVDWLVVDDKHVTGDNVGVAVYPLFNVTTLADNNDISGHFTIRIGSESTVPLSYQATDSKVLNAVQNLTSIGRVAMIGARDFAGFDSVAYSANAPSVGSCSSFAIYGNLSSAISTGDRVSIPSLDFTGFVVAMNVSDAQTYVYLNSSFTAVSQTITVNIGTLTPSRIASGARITILPEARVVNASSSTSIVTDTLLNAGYIFIEGERYT
eukprot:gene18307-21978_t